MREFRGKRGARRGKTDSRIGDRCNNAVTIDPTTYLNGFRRPGVLERIGESLAQGREKLFEIFFRYALMVSKGTHRTSHHMRVSRLRWNMQIDCGELCHFVKMVPRAVPSSNVPTESYQASIRRPRSRRCPAARYMEERTSVFIVYVLICSDGSLYTGWTRDMAARLAMHEKGEAARYTRSRLPCKLLAWWEAESRPRAMSEEARFKRLTRKQKLGVLSRNRNIHLACDVDDGIDAVGVIVELLRKNRQDVGAVSEGIDDADIVTHSGDFACFVREGDARR